LFQIFSTILCDLLWFNRNKVFHGGSIPNITKLAESIKKNASAHFAAWKSPHELESASWVPPSKCAFKVNFDTAIREHFSAQVVVCWDHSGRILKASSQISPSCDLNYGEALVAQLTLSLAATLQLKNFTLESDSQIVIFALNFHAITFDWHIKHVIANSLSMFLASTFWEARKVKRRANFFTHHVTHWAAARGFSGCIPISILFFLLLLSSPVMVLASGLTMQPVSTSFQ
jgi:hypothetical protein